MWLDQTFVDWQIRHDFMILLHGFEIESRYDLRTKCLKDVSGLDPCVPTYRKSIPGINMPRARTRSFLPVSEFCDITITSL